MRNARNSAGRRALRAGIIAAALIAAPAQAQDSDIVSQVRALLDSGAATHAGRGHANVRGSEHIGEVNSGSYQLWRINVRRGENYVFYGACQDGCSDLDMEVYDADGVFVEADVRPDNTPFLQMTPARSGRATVRVWTASCMSDPCVVGVRAMSGGEVIDRSLEVSAPTNGPAYVARVRTILDESSPRHLGAGFAAWGEETIHAVRLEGDGLRQTLSVQSGKTYRVQAACDQDCADIDIEVLTPEGVQVASDFAYDNNPFVEFTAASTGAYVARVWLVTCEQEPCFVGVRTFER